MNTLKSKTIRWLLLILFFFTMSNMIVPDRVLADTIIPINQATDLELIRSNPSGHFQLTTDIALVGAFTPIPHFNGTLDGNGHHISGLTITSNASQPKAAFIENNQGTIEKIGFTDVMITGLDTDSNYWASGIVATNTGTIQESFVTGIVRGGYRSAGIVVHNHGTIRNTYAVVSVQAKIEGASLVAVSESGSLLENSYAVPDVSSLRYNTGGITAYGYTGATIRNTALLAGTISNGDNNNIARIIGRLNGSPTLQNNRASTNALVQGNTAAGGTINNRQGLSVADSVLRLPLTYEKDLKWNFHSIWTMSSELGRPVLRNVLERKPIEIATASDLELIRNNPAGDYKLIANIDLTEPFIPIPTFSGTLNGDGHIISGLFIQAETGRAKAAFIIENTGIIERLGLADVTVMGSSNTSAHWVGGMTATNRGMIRESFIQGIVTGGYRSAGIAVHNYGVIKNTYADVSVRAKVEAASLVAVSEGGSILASSLAIPNVHSVLYNTGGISAYAYTNAIIQNNALLAGTITNGDHQSIARVTGRINGTPTFQNNIASKNVLVQGTIVSGGTANNHHGLSVNDHDLTKLSTYQTMLGWNFEEVWELNAEMGRPVLQYFDTTPTWDHDLIIHKVYRDVSETIATGVIHRQMDFIDTNGHIQKANILDVDLSLPQNKIIVGTADNEIPETDENGNYVRTKDATGVDRMLRMNVAGHASSTESVTGKLVIAGVNGEYYTKEGPEGYMIKDGSTIINGVRVPGADGKNYPFHGFFGIRNDGSAVIGDYGVDWETEKGNLFQASGGQYQVVKNGNVPNFTSQVIANSTHPDYDNETYYRHKERHPRTAGAIRADGSVFFVVIDGRGANQATGFYIEELGQYLKELGAYQALNMDGGGSSTMITYDSILDKHIIRNTPINRVGGVNTPGVPRNVFSSLLIVVDET